MCINLVSSGTLLEYFDFISFSIMYKHIPFIQGAGILVQFVLGYGFRLLGSLLLLNYTKKTSTPKILALSIMWISGSTLIIGLLPNHQYSFWALILLRAVQSIAFAVEFPTGSTSFKQDKLNSSVVSGATQGYILASMLCAFLFTAMGQDGVRWVGWRIPFLLGGSAGLLLTHMRLRYWLNEEVMTEETSRRGSLFINFALLAVFITSYLLLVYRNSNTPILQYLPSIISAGPNKLILVGLAVLVFYENFSRFKLAKLLTYCLTLGTSITQSMVQAYLVSASPTLSNINTISLVFSALYASIGHLNLFSIKLSYIPVLLILVSSLIFNLTGLNLIQHIYSSCGSLFNASHSLLIIFILNQMFITSFMINSIKNAKDIFQRRSYLIPLVYNCVTFVSAWILNSFGVLKANYLATLFKTENIREILLNPAAVATISASCLNYALEYGAVLLPTLFIAKLRLRQLTKSKA